MSRLPTATTFSHGRRSQCADLAELLRLVQVLHENPGNSGFSQTQRKHLAEYIMAERLLLITWFGSKREFEPDLFLINGKNCRLQEPSGGGKIFERKIPGLHAAKIGTGNVIRKRFMRFPISNRRKLFQGIRGSVWTEQNSYRCKISQKHLLQT